MAGRSLFRRLLGNRSDAVGPDDVSTAPNPAGGTPVPYPNTADGADVQPTAFDEADAVFGTRTEVTEAVVSSNSVVADPDDDPVLADLSGGSIDDQLATNAGFSSDATEFGLTDDLDDLDDLDID